MEFPTTSLPVDAQAASIKLPSSVFASEFEEEVGLLNKAAPISGELRIPVKREKRTDFRGFLGSAQLRNISLLSLKAV